MFVIKIRQDYEKLKNSTKTKEELMKKKLKEKLSKESFCHGMQKLFQRSIVQQKRLAE